MEKIFVGRTQSIETKYGEIIKLGLKHDDLVLMEQHMNAGGWVNLNICTSSSGNKYTEIDQFKPKKQDPEEASADAHLREIEEMI